MRRLFLLILLLFAIPFVGKPQQKRPAMLTPFERSNGKESATWEEAIDFYRTLVSKDNRISIKKVGEADGRFPLYLIVYSASYSPTTSEHVTILINNGIHAGEPDGVDASMMLLRDISEGKITISDNVILAIVPVYNVGGFVNRGRFSRVNQNGPLEYGFRGNGQNLDLNRDFIKCDAVETVSLEGVFTALDPDVFIDNHVSDGADYQHVMTLLPTQHDKLGGQTGDFMYKTLTPKIYKDMKKVGYDLVPYVNDFDNTPVNGWREFIEPPRFASGYAALFQTIAYVPETHVLKPFKDRVVANLELMKCIINEASQHAATIKKVRAADMDFLIHQQLFPLDWKIDSTRHDDVTFKGYAAKYKTSEVSGLPRLYYDREEPFTKVVPFYDHYIPSKTVTAPKAYIIPQVWEDVIYRLRMNGAEMEQLKNDTSITVSAYHIDNHETGGKPYEKHYLHKNVQVTSHKVIMNFRKGDYIIWVNKYQRAKRYIIETLEPTAPDAFLAWNFFDGILQQKEYFSDYVFEDVAAGLLKKDASLKQMLEEKKQSDSVFAKSSAAQLDFVYRHSPYMEPGYMRYPVYRLE